MSDDDDDAANELLDEEDDPLPEDLMCVCRASAMQHSSPCDFTLHMHGSNASLTRQYFGGTMAIAVATACRCSPQRHNE